jgi:hypothetical protein
MDGEATRSDDTENDNKAKAGKATRFEKEASSLLVGLVGVVDSRQHLRYCRLYVTQSLLSRPVSEEMAREPWINSEKE